MTGIDDLELEMSKLQVTAGDVVVVRLGPVTYLTEDELEVLREALDAVTPLGVRWIVLPGPDLMVDLFETLVDRGVTALDSKGLWDSRALARSVLHAALGTTGEEHGG